MTEKKHKKEEEIQNGEEAVEIPVDVVTEAEVGEQVSHKGMLSAILMRCWSLNLAATNLRR